MNDLQAIVRIKMNKEGFPNCSLFEKYSNENIDDWIVI
jgi:hypothetical protein